MDVSEGNVDLSVPEQPEDGKGEDVFFNPVQELNRDLTVAVLRTVADRNEKAETYLDATAASGVRGVRAAAEGWDVTLSDVDADAADLCRENLERNDLDGEVVHRDANAVMHDRRFDVIDVDPFGTPIPFADAAFSGARHFVAVTATDTAPLCGAHFESGVRSYSAVPRNTDYHPEMGVRVLLSALARTAARYDVGVTPVFTHATRHYVRSYLSLSHRATDANRSVDELGAVHHCQDCLYREAEEGLIHHPPETCPNCGSDRVITAAPLWLAPTRDREFVAAVRGNVTEEMGAADTARDLCDTLEEEIDRPTHYDQHRLCKVWGRPASAMDDFLETLRAAGFDASRAHYGGTTFKTDASVGEIREATE